MVYVLISDSVIHHEEEEGEEEEPLIHIESSPYSEESPQRFLQESVIEETEEEHETSPAGVASEPEPAHGEEGRDEED